jgi:3-hydroxyisobutyrate dehydrogenase-like beta-hydroxyacid dehydrogenase
VSERIAFLGLGYMGEPMARRLVNAGHEVTVWNRSPGRTERLEAEGAAVAPTPAEAAANAEVFVTMLTDGGALEPVLFGEHGAASTMTPGSVLIEMSTIGPEAVFSIADRLPDGVDMIDAPVKGTVSFAEAGDLGIFAGGEELTYERAKPVLEVLGKPRRMGALGSGAAVKLVLNAALLAPTAAALDVLAFAEELGIDRRSTMDLLKETVLASVADRFSDVVDEEPEVNFKLSLARKDLDLVVKAVETRLPVIEAARARFKGAEDAGKGDRDFSALLRDD